MQLLHLASALTALVTHVSSAPTPQPNYWWNVTLWDAGCGPNACSYSFHVAAPLNGMYPGFKADCSGKDKGYFTACKVTNWETTTGIPRVAAKLKHQPDPTHPNGVALMGLSLLWMDEHDGATYNYTGSHTAVFNDGGDAGKRFRVYPIKRSANIP